MNDKSVSIRPARREDVPAIVAMLADVSLLAYTRVAHEGGFDLGRYAAIRRWIGETETYLGLPSAR